MAIGEILFVNVADNRPRTTDNSLQHLHLSFFLKVILSLVRMQMIIINNNLAALQITF